ncbi:MAG: cupin domain-containing protein [Methanoregula sp.]
MKITEVAKVAPSKNPHNVDVRKIFESPDTSAVIITLKPGESLKKHVTPVDVFFYVLEGTGIIEIGDERQSVSKDSVVESPAMIAHTWKNEGKAVFRVMVVKMLTTGKGKEAHSRLL